MLFQFHNDMAAARAVSAPGRKVSAEMLHRYLDCGRVALSATRSALNLGILDFP